MSGHKRRLIEREWVCQDNYRMRPLDETIDGREDSTTHIDAKAYKDYREAQRDEQESDDRQHDKQDMSSMLRWMCELQLISPPSASILSLSILYPDLTGSDIADICGISRQAVSKRRHKMIKEMPQLIPILYSRTLKRRRGQQHKVQVDK